MARKFQIKRGLRESIPELAQGELAMTTDAGSEGLFIGTGTGTNIEFARKDELGESGASDHVNVTQIGDFTGKTISDLRSALDNWLTSCIPNVGVCQFSAHDSFINLWNANDLSTEIQGGSRWTCSIISSYIDTNYVRLAITSYYSDSIYILSKTDGSWETTMKTAVYNADGDLLVDGNIQGKWLKTTEDNHRNYAANKIAVIDGSGWLYYRTPSEALSDMGGASATADGTVTSGNADYAEVGEWADGNTDDEDRIGYFVAIDETSAGRTMVKATSTADVRGVTVTAPAFAGGYSSDKVGEDGNLLTKYDFVAVMGIVSVIDNGTCTVNERCMPGDDGTAVPSTNSLGYHVMERVDDTHVLIAVEPGADMIQRVKTDVTELQTGKAPSGYGYGEKLTFSSWEDSDGSAFENFIDSNFANENYSSKVIRLTNSADYPANLISGNGGFADVSIISNGQTVLIVYYGNVQNGIPSIAIKQKFNGTWHPWQYVNPPMNLGVEYRTTERYQGKPVYTMVVNFGNYPASGEKSVAHGISNVQYIVSCDGIGSPGYSANGYTYINYLYADTINVNISMNADISNSQLRVILKYTKTTG